MRNRATGLIYLCTFLLTAAVLALEVSLTRIFSVMSYHHLTFVVISLATLGFGIAGSVLSRVDQAGAPFGSRASLSRSAFYFGFATVLALLFVTSLDFDPLNVMNDWHEVARLLVSQAVLAVPFFFAGTCLVRIVTLYQHDIHRIYFADLLGASAGSLASVGGLWLMGAVNTILFVGLLGAVVGLLLGGSERGRGRVLQGLGVAVLMACWLSGLWFDPYIVHACKGKELTAFVSRERGTGSLESSRWHMVARVDVTTSVDSPIPWFGGNLSDRYRNDRCQFRMITQDGGAITGILKSDGDLKKMPYLGGYLQALPYALQKDPKVLVIGVGGGVDILIGLYHGARHVTGVELNPLMVRAITCDHAGYAGGLFNRPDVKLLVREGRHFLSTTQVKYDVIQLSGVDTFSALSTGAYAMAENYLYTVEAIDSSLDHLAPDGVLSYSRWILHPPRETLRLAGMIAAALERRGVREPARHVVIVSGETWAETLVKNEPFSAADLGAVRRWAGRQGFQMSFDPARDLHTEYDAVLRTDRAGRERFAAAYLYDISPSTDDQPFFFNYVKWDRLWSSDDVEASYFPMALFTLLWSLAQCLVLAGVGILLPLWRRQGGVGRPGSGRYLFYFSALGLGFMFVEVTLIQKLMVFLGGPTIALAFTLFAILLFSGLGSLFARRWADGFHRVLPVVIGALVVLVVGAGLLIDRLVPAAMSLAWLERALLATALIAPVAFVLGMPFPLGLRALSRHCPDWVPWAWATNSFMTVLGPLLCILLSMQVGFQAMFLLAALVYLAGFLALRPQLARAGGEDRAAAWQRVAGPVGEPQALQSCP